MRERFIGIVAFTVVTISVFLPMVDVLGFSITLYKASREVAIFLVISGVVVAAISNLGRRWLNLINVGIGIMLIALVTKYQADAKHFGIGTGLWLMLCGGILSMASGFFGLANKKQVKQSTA